jgi:amino acid adenylation domain-containing protein/non-ribosomal peptide synthase protein (TIGR01720 family)
MSAQEIIKELRKHNVVPRLDGDQLKLVGETGALVEDVIARVRSAKRELIAFLKSSTDEFASAPIPVIGRSAYYAASNAQKRIWILSQFEGGAPAYNIVTGFYLKGSVDDANLARAFKTVIQRHESLRTVFGEIEGELKQIIREQVQFELEVADVAGSGQNLKQLVKSAVEQAANHRFDLSNGPLMHVQLLHLGKQEHAMVLTMHHIISDGWSVTLMLRELMNYYNAYCREESPTLDLLPIQYKEYTEWMNRKLETPRAEALREFWKNQLAAGIEPLNLGADFVRPVVRSFEGALLKFLLPQEQHAGIAAFCRQHQCTPFVFFQSTVAILLSKISGQDTITIGSAVSGRNHYELEDQIGLYINTLPLQNRINSNESFVDFLKHVSDNTFRAMEYQEYPFDKIVDTLAIQSDAARNPLFDVMVMVQNTMSAEDRASLQRWHGFELQPVDEYIFGSPQGEFENMRSRLDLTFNFTATANNTWVVELEYSTRLFKKETIARFWNIYSTILAQVLQQPSLRIASIKMVNADEEARILHGFNQPAIQNNEHTIATLWEKRMQLSAGSIALQAGAKTFTYHELNALTNQFAAYLLQQYQLVPGNLVAISLERSEWMVIAILSVLKAGGAYVPIDPLYPQERREYILTDSGCKLVIDQQEIASFLENRRLYSEGNLPLINQPNDLAYVMYTSGSTGKPKGVMIEHRNITSFVDNLEQRFFLQSGYAFGATTNFTFDISVLELVISLLHGMKLVMVNEAEPAAVLQAVAAGQLDVLQLTPSRLGQLLEQENAQHILAKLKVILVGGEALPQDKYELLKQLPSTKVVHVYGPTETTIWSTACELHDTSLLTIGKPLINENVLVRDRHQALCPAGIIGEICIGGAGVARGYLNRQELTGEKFVPHPFAEGERLYRTGDIGRWLDDGSIEFIGRLDDQVKLRGHRIELGEIEAVIRQFEGIRAAAVIAEARQSDYELIAYVVSNVLLNRNALRAYLQQQLPAYMIPSFVVELDALPLMVNGKVDRKRLPKPTGDDVQRNREQIAPRTVTEERLAELWSDILGLEKTKISVTDNFFELGGHSLKATRLSARLYRAFGTQLELKELLLQPVLEQQAQLIERASQTRFENIEATATAAAYPLSASQRRIWLLSQFAEASTAYNLPGAYLFEGAFSKEALSYGFSKLLQRHESLRTVFRQDNAGEVSQVVLPETSIAFTIDYRDLRHEAQAEKLTKECVEQDFVHLFDLGKGPLLRACLYQLGEQQWVLSYVMHHIISDGWSMGILIRELLGYYQQYLAGITAEIAPLRIQYRDYAAWQQQQLNQQSLQEDRSYWLQLFNGSLPVVDLPSDKPRPAVKTYGGSIVYRQIETGTYKAIRNLGLQKDATLFMSMVSVVNALLYKYTGQNDLIIGSPVAARQHPDLEEQIGFYANTLALRTRFSATDNFYELLEKVKQVTLGAQAHQAYPFDELVRELQLVRDRSRHPLFDIQVIVQNEEANLAGLIADGFTHTSVREYREASLQSSVFDLVFNFVETGSGLDLSITYNRHVYTRRMVEQLAAHLEQLMKAVVNEPAGAIGQLQYLQQAEVRQLTDKLNETEIAYEADATLVSLFQKQVLQRPNETALVFYDQQLTYQQLHEQSNKLANYLQANHSFRPDERVGILLDRSAQLVIAMLAVMKAGAAYVPIDTKYPAARKQFILEDAAIPVLITQSDYLFDLDFYTGSLFAMDVQFGMIEDNVQSPVTAPGPQQLAYVIYTSGSTGQPKGVMIEQGAIANTVQSQQTFFDVHPGFHHLQFASASFDASVSEIFVALCSGGVLYVINEEEKKDPALLKEFINNNKIDIATIPPAYFQVMQVEDVQTLKRLVTAGEAAIKEKVAGFAAFGDYFNAYGPTETSICTSVYKNAKGGVIEFARVPIGRPIANTRVYILGADGQVCARGVAGEICVSGAGIARGYLNREALTAEKFVADPFRRDYRMYKTGDRGRWLEQGELEFLGRIDEQVKIRGYRIEPAEVESALQQAENVSQAVVAVRDNANGEKELIAYVVGENVQLAQVRAFAASALPAYMLPHHYILLPALPLNNSGKVDKGQLPAVEESSLEDANAYVAPRTVVEAAVISVYEEVLRKKPIGVKEDFFVLGGDSIKSIQVVSRLKQKGYSLAIQDVLTYPVVEDLCRMVKENTRQASQGTEEGYINLSPIQRYFFEAGSAEQHHYNQAVLLKAMQPLSADGLRACFDKLVAQHDVLRMVFPLDAHGNRRQFNRGLDQQYGWEEVQVTNADQLTAHCQRLQSSIDLAEGPLLKACLFKGLEADHLFILVHHLVIDGVSWRILFEDLALLYSQYHQQQPLQLPLKTDSFGTWQLQVEEYAAGTRLAKETAYWDEVERAAGEAKTLTPSKDGSNCCRDEETVSFVLDREHTARLVQDCFLPYHTGMNDILVTALSAALQQVLQAQDLVLNMEAHGREDIGGGLDLTRTIGWFTAAYPVVLHPGTANDARQLLIAVKDCLHRVPHKGIGYGILRYINRRPYSSKPPVNFNYLGDFGEGITNEQGELFFELSKLEQGAAISPLRQRDALLDVSAMMVNGCLQLSVAYSNQQFERQQMEQLAGAIRLQLEQLIAWLAPQKEEQLTASDLTYNQLSAAEFNQLNAGGDLENAYRLSPLQEGLYYHWLSAPDSASYFIQTTCRVNGALDPALLQESYNQLVARHAVLRSYFTQEHGELLQVVSRQLRSPFVYTDISTVPDIKAEVEVRKQEDRSQHFDLHQGSQMRLLVLKAGEASHEFIWSHHHILMDGWCAGILIREFFEIYHSLESGQPVKLPPAAKYEKYIQWLEEVDQQESLRYWQRYLDGYEPADRLWEPLRGMQLSASMRKLSFTLPAPLMSALRAACIQSGITESTFLQAVWGLLMGRYTNSNDLVFGSVVSGRPAGLEGVEEMIGLFSNTVPVRVSWQKEDTVAGLLKQLQEAWIAGSNHHYVQLAEVQAGRELFNQLMVVENYPVQEMLRRRTDASGKISFVAAAVHEQTNYDLTITVIPGDSFTLTFDYNANLYQQEQMERLQQHFIRLAEQAAANPNLQIQSLEILDDAERHQIIEQFNETDAAYDEEATVVTLFEQQVLQTPASLALSFEGNNLTYQQVNERANQLANYLRAQHGIGRHDLVAILLERSEWMVISMLAVLKAGAVYVPIDLRYPTARIQFVLQDSSSKLLLDEQELNKFFAVQDQYDAGNLPVTNQPADLAYIIYTSGTTGNPKGVMITHGNVVRLFKTEQPLFAFGPADVWTMFHSYSFDFSVWEMYGALLFGARLVVVPMATAQDPAAFLQLLKTEAVTVLNQTPSAFYQLAAQEVQQPVADLGLRYIIFAGEALSPARLQLFYQRYPATKLINMYGITEITVHATYKEVGRAEIETDSRSVGKPIPTLTCYVLGNNGALAPIGVAGELYVGGAGVARGYLNRETLTAQRFIESPFKTGERLYRSGDRARLLPDGELEYGGRLDEQVKIRGYRIELGEIEAAIKQYPGISAVAVIAAKTAGEQELIAYVVAGEALNKPALRNLLQEKLPAYMVPAYFVQLAAMPLTTNGKLDKKKLPQPSGSEIETGNEYVSPRTVTEERLVKIWSQVLNLPAEKISVKDNFFEAGGHSLKATKLAGHIYRAFETRIALRDLFVHPVLEAQALLVEQSTGVVNYSIPQQPAQADYPLSSSQQRLWLLSQFGDANAAYNVPAAYFIEGSLNRSALQHAFAALIQRHESLRTVFRENDKGDTRQVVLPSDVVNFSLPETDLRGMGADVSRLLQQDSREQFDLAAGPLLRVRLYRIGDDLRVLSFVMHHIISDAWSAEILLDELLVFYAKYQHGYEGALPALRIQYKDYAGWEQEQLKDGLLKAQREYWLRQLEGDLPVVDLPIAKPRPAVQTFNGQVIHKNIPAQITNGLRHAARGQGATLFMGLLAGVNALLYKYTGQHEFVLGSPIAGREHADLHDQVGFYTNTLALRTQFDGKYSFQQLLNQTKEVTVGAYAHQLYPFDQLVEDLGVRRDMSRNALFDISVVLQNQSKETSGKNLDTALKFTPYAVPGAATSKFDLTFDFTEAGEDLQLSLEYNTDLFEQAAIEKLLQHFEQLLAAIVQQPLAPLASINYLSQPETTQLLQTFSKGGAAFKGRQVVLMFEEQVRSNSSAVAVQAGNTSLTYHELNERANQFAHYLKNNFGLTAHSLAGIQLERSEWMPIALLAVLKAGGAYLPIDPAYPAERIAYMLADSGCKLLIDAQCIETFNEVRNQYSGDNLLPAAQPSDLAYVIYTSGSTGQPKGCCITHGSLGNYIAWANSYYFQSEGQASFGLFTSLSFDLTVTSIYCPLTTGGCLHVYPQHEDVGTILPDSFQSSFINSIKLTPSHILLLKQMNIGSSHIQCAIVGGEEMQPEHVRILKGINPAMRIYNEYGPTEATVGCIVKELSLNEAVLIGRPIAGASIYILDEGLQPAPIGIPGEIYIAGAGMANGYLDRPALTAEKFIANPFEAGERLYKTGDQARWLPDGNIAYMGRKDEQVKLRGYRVELSEIENAIISFEGVQAAVAILRKDEANEKDLVAYFTSKDEVNIAGLRRHLANMLPAYMVPTYLLPLEKLPLTPNGKVDKRQLPDPKTVGWQQSQRVAPRNEIEEKLVAIWSEVLNIEPEKISVTDSFFELGGHSLKANRLVMKIHKEFDTRVELRELFSRVVLEQQAALIAQTTTTSFATIPAVPAQTDYPLSSSQRRLWVLSRFADANVAYNIPGVYIFEGALNREALAYAFNQLISRHEILRTLFREDALGEVRQYILPAGELEFAMEYADLRGQALVEEKIAELVRQNSARPFDLSTAPLVRAALYQAADNRWVFNYVLHHIISDGWSMGILIAELMKLYNARIRGEENTLPGLRIQYKDFAVWQQQQLGNQWLRTRLTG